MENEKISRKTNKMMIKEKFGLDEHIEVPDKLIPSTSEKETNLLDLDTMLILKRHYIAQYCFRQFQSYNGNKGFRRNESDLC
jgi:hypothetical protein